jgi:hypothetical protein
LVNDDATMAGGIVTPNFMELLMQLSGQMTALWSEQVANRQAIQALQENLAAAASTSIATSTAPTKAINFDPMDIDEPAELNTNGIGSGNNTFGCHHVSINRQETKGCQTCK